MRQEIKLEKTPDGELWSTLIHLADVLQFYMRMEKCHSCNDCRRAKECEHRPAWGDPVRLNCFLWEGDEDDGDT